MTHLIDTPLPSPLSKTYLVAQIIFANAIPLVGVIFYHWDARLVLLTYIIETIILGLAHLLRMILVHVLYGSKPSVVARAKALALENNSNVRGWAIIPFFTFHYFMFVGIQTVIFGAFTSMGNHSGPPTAIFYEMISASRGTLFNLLIAFSFLQTLQLAQEFISGKYRESPVEAIFFQPYSRIFVQQFMVILGGFLVFAGFRHMGYLLVLVAAKLVVDLFIVFSSDRRVRRLLTRGDPEKEKGYDDLEKMLR